MAQDFNHQDLRGKSYRDQDLTGADFSHADIRGADFSRAILVRTDFTQALAGQRYHWLLCLAALSSLLASLSGFIIGWAAAVITSLMVMSEDWPAGLWSGIVVLILLTIVGVIAVRKGLGSAIASFSLAVALVVVIVVAFGKVEAIAGVVLVHGLAFGGAIAGTILGATAVSSASMLFRNAAPVSIGFALIGCVPGVLAGMEGLKNSQRLALIIGSCVALLLLGLSVHISRRVMAGDRNYFVIPAVATTLASLGGTRFRGADLTDANFTRAHVKGVDFRKATLKRTCWFQSDHVGRSRLQGTYLESSRMQELLITKSAPGQNYDHLDLRGLNLEGANLQDASLIGTDFNESSLRNANLTGAKLAKAQLYQTDLMGTCLTGAYIQDWGISTETNLSDVKCDYVYMRLPTKDDPDPCRKPDNRLEKFQPGDFSDFIAPIIKTLGLYQNQGLDPRIVASRFKTLDLFHYEGIDPSVAALTIQRVSQKHPEAQLEVIALEGRGNERIRLQAKVTGTVDRSQLSKEYFEVYERVKSLSDSDVQGLLVGVEEKDVHIRRLEKLLESALKQPKFYVETYRNEGDFIMAQEKKGNIEISGVHGNVSGLAAAGESQTMTGVSLGVVSGKVTNTINQLPASSDPDQQGIKELLTELLAAIEGESELSDDDKVEALAQVGVFAEAGQKPEDSVLQKASKTAMKILKGTLASLPDAAKLAEAGARLLPAIAALLA